MSTYAACLTPAGTGAITTVAVRGPAALEIVQSLFRGRCAADAGSLHLGQFGAEVRDQVVLHVKRTAPLPWVELHCHGGRAVVALVLEALQQQGIAVCSWQEFLQRTAARPWQAEAAVQLASAPTARTAAILLDQYHGALDRALDELAAALERQQWDIVKRLLGEQAARVPLGRHLIAPWRVVVAGAPNVGKSSLVNALAGYQRSIVSATPGTTRDLVSVSIALDGWPIELCDTAGLRDTDVALEGQGIRLAEQAAASADLCVWVLDGTTPPVAAPSPTSLVVINKIDQPPGWDHDGAPQALRVSALTGAGMDVLVAAITRQLVPDPPPPGAAVPFTPEICTALKVAWQHWQAGQRDEAVRLLVATAPSGSRIQTTVESSIQ
ncbi:MAG: 50S ribosome-binding GTPase [Planctomycetia bacterium]|nr:50S ribosome-binding GTPase [Planctomycetia bacterium]